MQSNPLLLDFLEGLFYRTSATATSSRDITEASTKIAVSAKVKKTRNFTDTRTPL